MQRLGVGNTATGFLGGFTGHFIEDSLKNEGIETAFVKVDQDTRINVKIKSQEETEINGQVLMISQEQLEALKAKLSQLTSDDTVVFADQLQLILGMLFIRN